MPRPKSDLTPDEKREKKKMADRLRRQNKLDDPFLLVEERLKERMRYLRRKAQGKIKLIKDKSKREQHQQRNKWRQNTANYRMKMTLQGDTPPSTPLPIISAGIPNSRRKIRGESKTEQNSDGDQSESETSYTAKEPPAKRQELDPAARQNELLKLACDLLSTSTKEEPNECLEIAKVWGTKLMSLDSLQRKFAEKAINDILFEADMGTLRRNSVQINSNSNLDPLEDP